MGDVFDLIAHMNDEPPAYRVLGWVNLKPASERKHGKARKESDTRELSKALGASQPVPDNARERALWAQQELARLNAATKRKKPKK